MNEGRHFDKVTHSDIIDASSGTQDSGVKVLRWFWYLKGCVAHLQNLSSIGSRDCRCIVDFFGFA